MPKLKWQRSEDGYTATHCGRWRISPLFMSCVKPQCFDLYHDGKKVGNMIATQRDAKERAQYLADASAMRDCLECDEPTNVLYEDPREPPLDADICLCRGCAEGAIEEVIEDHEREIADLKRKLRKLRKAGK